MGKHLLCLITLPEFFFKIVAAAVQIFFNFSNSKSQAHELSH